MQKRKIPMRQCLGCREMFDKRVLARIVRSPEGEVSLDFTGKKAGRGAYVCKNAQCLAKVRKSKALDRAFSCAVPEEVFEGLEKQLEESAKDE